MATHATKARALEAFLAKWANLPEQRSPEWLAARRYSIGASELSTLQGTNPYQNIYKLIGKKFNLLGADDMRAMNWGNVLEPVVTRYAEIIFNCVIHAVGAIPVAGMRNHASSPDGVAQLLCFNGAIVTFEFKAPLRRIPNGRVPAYYMSQILSQLCAVEPAEFGIFVDVALRKCAPSDWSFGSLAYDQEYHAPARFDEVYALTIVLFYRVNDAGADDTPPIDLGSASANEFDSMLSQVAVDRAVRAEYGRVWTCADELPKIDDELARASSRPIAYLPLKMLKCTTVPVSKQPDFVLQFQPLIDRIMASVRAIDNTPADERMAVFERECATNHWGANDGRHRH